MMSLSAQLDVPNDILLKIRSPPEVSCLLQCHSKAITLDQISKNMQAHVIWLYKANRARANLLLPHPQASSLATALVLLDKLIAQKETRLGKCKAVFTEVAKELQELSRTLLQFAEVNQTLAMQLELEDCHDLAASKKMTAETEYRIAQAIEHFLQTETTLSTSSVGGDAFRPASSNHTEADPADDLAAAIAYLREAGAQDSLIQLFSQVAPNEAPAAVADVVPDEPTIEQPLQGSQPAVASGTRMDSLSQRGETRLPDPTTPINQQQKQLDSLMFEETPCLFPKYTSPGGLQSSAEASNSTTMSTQSSVLQLAMESSLFP